MSGYLRKDSENILIPFEESNLLNSATDKDRTKRANSLRTRYELWKNCFREPIVVTKNFCDSIEILAMLV